MVDSDKVRVLKQKIEVLGLKCDDSCFPGQYYHLLLGCPSILLAFLHTDKMGRLLVANTEPWRKGFGRVPGGAPQIVSVKDFTNHTEVSWQLNVTQVGDSWAEELARRLGKEKVLMCLGPAALKELGKMVGVSNTNSFQILKFSHLTGSGLAAGNVVDFHLRRACSSGACIYISLEDKIDKLN
ncbi:hypothetical protein NC653_004870 [Populus alba x Populus x berolinensis]|uniref:Uncharacterized protein n=1 Tax=Populus alba x Populus x berolinensis TaxID=444605 RepID=A0AAD6RWQ2_9ROSI|nr:hypothetical protein NC653_004870 [Populus alba x Populus x berolinensis]